MSRRSEEYRQTGAVDETSREKGGNQGQRDDEAFSRVR